MLSPSLLPFYAHPCSLYILTGEGIVCSEYLPFVCSIFSLSLDFKKHVIYLFSESWHILTTEIIAVDQATSCRGKSMNIPAQQEASLPRPSCA